MRARHHLLSLEGLLTRGSLHLLPLGGLLSGLLGELRLHGLPMLHSLLHLLLTRGLDLLLMRGLDLLLALRRLGLGGAPGEGLLALLCHLGGARVEGRPRCGCALRWGLAHPLDRCARAGTKHLRAPGTARYRRLPLGGAESLPGRGGRRRGGGRSRHPG